jgi:CsoR family transcriptional regulator, copper-sensing transcriptional repressor
MVTDAGVGAASAFTGRTADVRDDAATHTPTGYHGLMQQPGYLDDKADVLKRLRRIEGQARGLQRMVEGEEYCIDILTQVSAMTKALQAVALSLLDDHLAHCVKDAVANGEGADEKLTEASAAIARLVRS